MDCHVCKKNIKPDPTYKFSDDYEIYSKHLGFCSRKCINEVRFNDKDRLKDVFIEAYNIHQDNKKKLGLI